MQEDEISQYKKIIKEKGIKDAHKIMQSPDNLHEGDFTSTHKSDDSFSDAATEIISLQTQEIPREIILEPVNDQNLDWGSSLPYLDINDKKSEQIIVQPISTMKFSGRYKQYNQSL